MEFTKNSIYEASVTDISGDGSGICKIDGYTVFVPYTAVGDKIRLKLLKANKNYGYGKAEQIISPSPDRADPGCGGYFTCGGCSLRHISYEAQLKLKQKIVKDAFERIGKITVPVDEIIGSEQTDGYRNKAQYPFGTDKTGRVIAGFFAKRSHRVVECSRCALQPEIFSDILSFTVDFANAHGLSAYNEADSSGLIRNLYLRRAETTGQIMVCLVATKKDGRFYEYARLLKEKFNGVTSVLLNINAKNTNVILGEKYITLYGADYITDELCGVKLNISAPSFYQINRRQAQRLYLLAREYADVKKGDVLLDLYCGTGSIGLSMAAYVKQLIGAEIIPSAVENAKKNAEAANVKNARFICADAALAAAQLAESGESPDIIILDPPRKGCSGECIAAAVKMSPKKIVMISCNPSTAARDCAEFVNAGYEVIKIRPVDMFPHTNHIETAILLKKK